MTSPETPKESADSVKSWISIFDQINLDLKEALKTGQIPEDTELHIRDFASLNLRREDIHPEISPKSLAALEIKLTIAIERLEILKFNPAVVAKLKGVFDPSAVQIGEEARERIDANLEKQRIQLLEQNVVSVWIERFEKYIIPALKTAENDKDIPRRVMELLRGFLGHLPDIKKLPPEPIRELIEAIRAADSQLKRLGHNLFDEKSEFTMRGQLHKFTQKLESAVPDEQTLVLKLDDHAKIQFRRAKKFVKISQDAFDKITPNAQDYVIQNFADRFTEALIFLTNECLEFSLKDYPEVIEYFKALVKKMTSHPNFTLVRNSDWSGFLEGEFVRFIELV